MVTCHRQYCWPGAKDGTDDGHGPWHGELTYHILLSKIGGAIEMEQYRKIVRIICSIEFRHIEEGLSPEAIIKIT